MARQEQHPGAAFPDRLGGSRAFVDVEVVPDLHVARLEDRRQLGGHIGVEGVGVDRPFYHPGRHQRVATQPGDEGLGITSTWPMMKPP